MPPPKSPIKARDFHMPTVRAVRPSADVMSNGLLTVSMS